MKAAFELSALHTQGEANGETLRQTADGRCEPGTLIGTHFPQCHHRHHKACVIVQTDKRGFEESEKLSAQSVLFESPCSILQTQSYPEQPGPEFTYS